MSASDIISRNAKKQKQKNKNNNYTGAEGIIRRNIENNASRLVFNELKLMSEMQTSSQKDTNNRLTFDKNGKRKTTYLADTGSFLDKVKKEKSDYQKKSDYVNFILNEYGNQISNEDKKMITDYLKSSGSYYDELETFAQNDHDYFSQFEDEKAYKRYVNNDTFSKKYAQSTYADLQKAKTDIEKKLAKEKDNEALNDELYWLQNHDTDRQYVDTMSKEELEALKKARETQKDEANAKYNFAKHNLDVINQNNVVGRAVAEVMDYFSDDYENPYNKAQSELGKTSAEKDKLKGDVLYYDDDGVAVTADILLNMRAAEEKYNMQNIPSAELEKDLEVINRARLWLTSQQSDATQTQLDYENSPEQAKADMEYLKAKYNIDDTAIPFDVLDSVKDLEQYAHWKIDKDNYADEQLKNAEYANKHPILATGKTILSAPLTALEFAGNVISDSSLRKDEYGSHNLINIYDDKHLNQNQTYQSAVADMIDTEVMEKTDNELLAWLASGAYSGVTSSAQSALTTGACMLMFGPAGGTVALGIMGTEAAASSYNNAIMNGSTNGEAILTAVSSGIAEAAFEKISLDRLINIGNMYDVSSMSALIKSMIKNSGATFVQGGVEASEEFFTEIANKLADEVINGDHSAYNTAVAKYKKIGYSDADAKQIASKDALLEIVEALYGGFIGGVGSGAGASAVQGTRATATVIDNAVKSNRYYNQQGQNIIYQGNLSQLEEEAKALGGKDVLKALKNLADETAGVKAEELDDKGKKKYAHQVGKLYKEVQKTQLKNLSESSKTAFKNVIKAELEKADVDNVDAITDILVKAAHNDSLTRAESKLLQSVNGHDILNKAYSSKEFVKTLSTEEKKQFEESRDDILDTVDLTHDKGKAKILAESNYDVSSDGTTIIEATGEEVNLMSVDSLEGDDISFKVKNGDSEQVVLAGELRLNEDYVVILEGLKDIKENFGLDVSSANSVLALWDGYTGNAVDFSKAMKSGIMYGQYNMRKDFENSRMGRNVPDNIREELFRIGREYKQRVTDERESDVKANGNANAENGEFSITYAEGVTYESLNDSQKAQVDFAQVIAKTFGFNLEIFRSPKNTLGQSVGENGSYNLGTNTMRLDVDAGTLDGKSLILFTQSHELTHFIKKWSPKAFKTFADLLVEKYGKKGVSVDERVNDKITQSIMQTEADKTGKHHVLSYEEAFEEVVCDACEDFLADPNIQQTIAEFAKVDKNLVQKIKDFLKGLITKLEEAIKGLQGQSKEAKALRKLDIEDLEDLKNHWAAALFDARENVLQAKQNDAKAEKNTTDEGDVKFSIKNIDLNKIQSMYGITDLKDYVHVQKKVFEKLTQTGFFDKNGSKVVINKATGIVVEINKSGIKETFGKGKRYEFQSKENKILKLATVVYLDEIIENAIVYSKSENYHNNDSQVEYLYLKHGVKINGKPYIIAVDIRMSPDKNKFWLHRMYDVTKENQQSFGEAKNNLKHPYLTIADEDSKPQNTKNVNTTDEKRQDRDSLKHSDRSIELEINHSMTMAEAKQMIQRAFVLGNIYEWYEGEYKNGDEWLRGEGSYEVALNIENEYSLVEKYLNKIQGYIDGDIYVEAILEAYLNGTLVGKEKPKAKRMDISKNYRVNDTRFYSPKRIENVKQLFEIAGQKLTSKNRAEVSSARAKILLFAHNKGASELLGLSQAELNKKLRSWSGYTNGAREISEKLNRGVADSNKWTGIENCSWLYKNEVTTEEIESLVKSIDGAADDYEKMYIARTMLALDTHIDWSWLSFKFDTYANVNKNSIDKCNGYYLDKNKEIVVSHNKPNTVAHEMGHALDYQWGRDLGFAYSSLTDVSRTTERITDADTRQFFDNFKVFIDSLTDNSDIRSEYTQNHKEVFARFVARFIQWVDNTGGNRTYTTEVDYYNDKFTATNYIEFVKLLQEKAMLDAKKMSNDTLEDVKFQDRQYQPSLEDLGIDYKEENEKLKADVDRLKEMLKLQGTVTHGKALAKASYEGVAKKLLHEFGMKRVTDTEVLKEFINKLDSFYSYIINEDDLIWEDMFDKSMEIARWIDSILPEQVVYKNPNAVAILRDIREKGIMLSDKQKEEATYYAGSLNAYRKMNIGNFRIVNEGGISLTDLWEQLVTDYPGAISKEYIQKGEVAENLPSLIVEVVDLMRQTEKVINDDNRLSHLREIATAIYDSYCQIPTVRTLADKHQQKVNLLKGQHKAEMDALKEKNDSKLKDTKEYYQDMVKRIRADKDAKMDAYKERVQEQKKKNVEGRNKTTTKNKIKRVVKELDKLLNKGNKKSNVKDGMQDMVKQALALSDLLLDDVISAETILSADIPDERLSDDESAMLKKWRDAVESRAKFQATIDNLEEKYGSNKPLKAYEELVKSIEIANKSIKTAERNLSGLLERERKRLNSNSVKTAIESLSKAYETLKDSNVDYISSAYDKNISDKLKNLVESLEGVNVKDMSLSDLQEVYTAYKMVLTTVRNANKLFVNGRKEDFDEINGLILQEISSHKKKKESKFEPADKVLEGARNFTHNNLKPLYFFEELGSDALKRIFYDEIARAQRVYAVDYREAREYIENARKKHNYYSWNNDSQTIKLLDGRTVKFSMQELMSIYAYSKRPQADKHMSEGGFACDNKAFFKDVEVDINGKKVKTRELRSDGETPYRITEFELAKIKKLLGKEKCEYVDDMQKYLSEDMADKGNSVTRIMYGIDIFTEKVYFPLKSSVDYKIPVSTTNAEFSLKGSGFTKETVPSAENPIALQGFEDVWARHVNEMATYHSLVLPIENMNKVLGYTEYINTPNSLSTKQIIRKVYGSSALNYIENYIQDMNGGFSSNKGAQNFFAKGFSNFKKTAVGASMSTVIQQPTAILRAMSMINPKYFVKYETANHKVLQDEMFKYAPISIIKQIGGFDAGGNGSAVSSLLSKEYKGIDKAKSFFEDKEYRKESFDDAMMLGATFADEIGWNIIWNAVKNEVKDSTTFMPGTDEFLNECGNRFDEVINATQVYDSVLSRSGYMRSNNELVKMSTAFMGEPSTSFNMLFNAVTQAKRGNISKTKAVGIVTSVYASVIAAAALKSLIYALRDDDDEESYVEKYMSALSNSLTEELWVHNMLPFLSDIATMFDGWEVERTDIAVFKDVVDAIKDLDSSSKSDWRKAEDLFGAFAGLFGIPLKNVMRTGREIYNAYANIFDGITADADDVGNAIVESLFGEITMADANEALEKGKTNKAKEIISDLVADKVEEGKTEKEAKTSIKSSVTSYWKPLYLQAYRDNDSAEMLRIRRILQSTGLYDNVVETCSNWIKGMKDETTDTTYTKW